jgi:hypothetical protein
MEEYGSQRNYITPRDTLIRRCLLMSIAVFAADISSFMSRSVDDCMVICMHDESRALSSVLQGAASLKM